MSLEVTDFFKVDYVDQASYDNLRKISSAVDGLKNSNRKVIHTVLDKNIKDLLKVQQLSAKAAEYTDYLHGSLDSVIVTLGQDYCGSNQLPLLHKKGNFGTRSIPEASAPRYIFAKGSELLNLIFLKEDRSILVHQEFEGEAIEPRYFVPTMPLLLVNGNRGVSSGFSQLIQPRSIRQVLETLIAKLNGDPKAFQRFDNFNIHIKGFKGNIYRDPEVPDAYKWIIEGKIEIGKKEVLITELPIETKLMPYVQFLDDLKEAKKIKDFKDECDGDNFQFRIIFNPKDLENHTEESLIKLLKLRSSITENFTSLGSDNKIKEFNHPSEILEHYYQTKMESLQRRKDQKVKELEDKVSLKSEQYRFIGLILSKEIDIQKLKSKELLEVLELQFKKFNNDYKYLTNMPVSSMQEDKRSELQKEIHNLNEDLETLKNQSLENLWLLDIKELAKVLKQKELL